MMFKLAVLVVSGVVVVVLAALAVGGIALADSIARRLSWRSDR